MAASVRTRQELLVEFDERGFLILDEALSPDQILVLNQAIDYHFKKYPVEWVKHDESLMETMTALSSMSDFDFTIENPTTLGVLRSLIGEGITFEEFEIIIRDPTAKLRDIKGWHRDLIRDYSRRMEINYISLTYYLTDVSANDHCFSIVPGTHNRRVDLRPEEVLPGMEFDVIGPGGDSDHLSWSLYPCWKAQAKLSTEANTAPLLRSE